MNRDSQNLKNEFLTAIEALNNVNSVEFEIPETLTSYLKIKKIKNYLTS